MSIEAMKQALEALRLSDPEPRLGDDDYVEQGWKEHNDAIIALRAAIAEASMHRITDVQQEMDCYGDGNVYRGQRSSDSKTQTIYEGSFPEKIWEVVPPRREWVISMAREAGLHLDGENTQKPLWVATTEELERFAALVAAAEREACAKTCLEEAPSLDGQLCAEAIRARGKD